MQSDSFTSRRIHPPAGFRRWVLGRWGLVLIAASVLAVLTYTFVRPETGQAAGGGNAPAAQPKAGPTDAPQEKAELTYQASDAEGSIMGIFDDKNAVATQVDFQGIGRKPGRTTRAQLDAKMTDFEKIMDQNLGWSRKELAGLKKENDRALEVLNKLNPKNDDEKQLKQVMQELHNAPSECRGRCLPNLPPGSGSKFVRTVLLGNGVLVALLIQVLTDPEATPRTRTNASVLLGVGFACQLAIWVWETYEQIQAGADQRQNPVVQEQAMHAVEEVADIAGRAVQTAETDAGSQRAVSESTSEASMQVLIDSGSSRPSEDEVDKQDFFEDTKKDELRR